MSRATTYSNTARTRQAVRDNRGLYVYGSAAPDLKRALEQPSRQLNHDTRKNRDKAHHMSFGYVVFLLAAVVMAGVMLVGYIQLQSAVNSKLKNIASLEKQLTVVREANNEELNRIERSVNLEEIKAIAIGQLGMTYAQEGQIVTYSNNANDYMRKVAE